MCSSLQNIQKILKWKNSGLLMKKRTLIIWNPNLNMEASVFQGYPGNIKKVIAMARSKYRFCSPIRMDWFQYFNNGLVVKPGFASQSFKYWFPLTNVNAITFTLSGASPTQTQLVYWPALGNAGTKAKITVNQECVCICMLCKIIVKL